MAPSRVSAPRSPFGFQNNGQTSNAPQAPFTLEWDGDREFIEGVQCNFAYRLRIHADVASLTLKIDVNGKTSECEPFDSLCDGDEREGTLPFVPKVAGAVSVRVFAEVVYEGGCGETFEAVSPFEHQACAFRSLLSGNNQNLNIDIRDNSGIIRLDQLKLPPQAVTDLDAKIGRALSRKGGWKNVPMAYKNGELDGREIVQLRGDGMDITVVVVSGASKDPVRFGHSAHRATLRLESDKSCDQYISGVHFTLLRKSSAILVRDGGPGRKGGWSKSTNGTLFDDQKLDPVSGRELRPGQTFRLKLAPYVVPGGALSLMLEARGNDVAIPGCDRSCNVSSVVVRRDDSPNRVDLVVWGATGIDDLLGTHAGLRVGLVRGRLHLIRKDGSSVRLLHLVGREIPGTGIFVQSVQ